MSGSTIAVERAMALAKERGAKRALALNVSAAFHSPLMKQAAQGLAAAVAEIQHIQPPQVPVISNVTAQPLVDPEAIRSELVAQVTAPVRWIASVERMVADGVTQVVEIGPGTVLTGLVKRVASSVKLVNVNDIPSMERWVTSAEAQ
jgi:[acyl-carrier-protein] S-malonyltransferase